MTVFSLIVFVQTLGALLGLVTIVVLYKQPASFYQKMLTVTATCSFIGLLSYLFEVLATNLEEALLAARFGYIGKSYAMVLFLIFIASYCDVRLPKWLGKSLLAFSTFILVLVLSCPYHSLYYTSIGFDDSGAFAHLVLGKGVIYYLFMIVTLLVMLIFVCISITTLFKRKGKERSRLTLLCLSGFVPAIALILNLLPFMKGFDPTPLGILISCCLVSYNVLRYGLLDPMQLAGANALDYANQGVVVVNKDVAFLYANSRAYDFFEELGDKSESKNVLDIIFKEFESKNSKTTLSWKEKIYEINYNVLEEESRKNKKVVNGYMAWIFDITEDYNYKRELEKLRMQAEEANHSKSIFLAKMSHEIRTPMNGIMGFADLALEKQQDKETEEYLMYIKNSADSLLGIINDVLDISKIESGKMEIIDVEYNPTKFFNDISALILAHAEEKGIEYRVNIPKDLPRYLYGDSIRFREILINILNNAVKYTVEGSVVMDVSVKEWGDDEIVLEIHVADTGIGIAKEKISDIFDVFEQGDNISNYYVEGTGLGLSIARQLAELMGGSITVESEYGKGSDFCIVIPQKYVAGQKKTEVVEEKTIEKVEINTSGVRALIVDDNEINLKVERGLLNKYNMIVDISQSGKECLELVKTNKYDIILMDHMMPEMDGVETFKAIREGDNINVTTPVILVTANAIVGIKEKMLMEGFDGFVSKPIDTKSFQKELAKVISSDKLTVEVDSTTQVENIEEKSTSGFIESLAAMGIDTEMGVKYCGDLGAYKDVLTIATNGAKEKITKLNQFLQNDDMENYRILIHSIKSSAANIGAKDISIFAKDLEYAVKDKDYDFIRDYTNDFVASYEKFMHEVVIILENEKEEQQDSLQGHKNEIISLEQWTKTLERIEYLLDELENDMAQELLCELLCYNVSEEANSILQNMKDSLEAFDIEKAKNSINSLKTVKINI